MAIFSLREVITFINVAGGYSQRFPAPTKLSYALARVSKRALKHTQEMDAEMEDVRTDNALTDEKPPHAILRDDRNQFKFTKEGLKAVMEKNKELLEKEVELEPYFATELPADLANDFRVEFERFVIDPDAPAPVVSAEPA